MPGMMMQWNNRPAEFGFLLISARQIFSRSDNLPARMSDLTASDSLSCYQTPAFNVPTVTLPRRSSDHCSPTSVRSFSQRVFPLFNLLIFSSISLIA
jgi:hypothetical protein